MITKIIEATNNEQNWGKFMVMQPDTEWRRLSAVSPLHTRALLAECGWTLGCVWVMDLQTGEGAYFNPYGFAKADLDKHQIWVCPLFEPFLTWLYEQDLHDLSKLPDMINLPDAPFEFQGYRRSRKETQ